MKSLTTSLTIPSSGKKVSNSRHNTFTRLLKSGCYNIRANTAVNIITELFAEFTKQQKNDGMM